MTQAQWVRLGVAILLVIIAMWLAAVEAAFHAMSRSRAHALSNDTVQDIAADPAPVINTSTLLRVIAQVVAILLVFSLFDDTLSTLWAELLVTAAIMTVVWYIIWGVGPQTLGHQHAEWVAVHSARTITVLTTVFGPLAQLLIVIGNAITPGRGFTDGPFTTQAELRDLVDYAEESDVIEEDEAEMIHSVFELGDTYAREVMVPRTDVITITADRTWRQGLALALQSGCSRIPVVGDSLDDVLGVLHVKDLMGRLMGGNDRGGRVRDVMRAPTFCPDSKPVDRLLRDMQATRTHMMIVVDEFGGMAGIVTLEDIVEEIVGEITDEYDPAPVAVQDLGGGAFRVPARLPLDELSELVDALFDDDDVETVAGLMAKALSQVPTAGSHVVLNGFDFTADEALGRRRQIMTLVVRPAEVEAAN